jgi:hypothetical protein
MKSIFFHSTPNSIAKTRQDIPLINGCIFPKARSITDLRASFGQTGNRGNTVHAEAPQKIFQCNSSTSACGNIVHAYKSCKDFDRQFNDKFDLVIFSLANFIRKNQNHEGLVNVIESLPIS